MTLMHGLRSAKLGGGEGHLTPLLRPVGFSACLAAQFFKLWQGNLWLLHAAMVQAALNWTNVTVCWNGSFVLYFWAKVPWFRTRTITYRGKKAKILAFPLISDWAFWIADKLCLFFCFLFFFPPHLLNWFVYPSLHSLVIMGVLTKVTFVLIHRALEERRWDLFFFFYCVTM